MGFMTKGLFGGALLGGIYGGYKSDAQGFGGFGTAVGMGAIKGAALGLGAGAGAHFGMKGLGMARRGISNKILNSAAASGTKIGSNAPVVTAQQAVRGAGLGSNVPAGMSPAMKTKLKLQGHAQNMKDIRRRSSGWHSNSPSSVKAKLNRAALGNERGGRIGAASSYYPANSGMTGVTQRPILPIGRTPVARPSGMTGVTQRPILPVGRIPMARPIGASTTKRGYGR